MKPDRWQQIDELFHAVAERAPHERAAFLDEACAGNDSLRREVESLLSADAAAEEMATAKLPARVAGELLDQQSSRLTAGQLLNQYRILSPLGAGGMGEVFLAEDTRLKRKIALKLLPALFTSDSDRVRRFEQEALAVSALNHPNILTIYEIGESERHHFLVTEFIEGQTLRQQMNDGRLPVRAVLNVATQIVSALAAAHAAGIIHRDIKPENIMLRPDGVVKVLDFGLAKLNEPRVSTADPAEKKASTESGVVMGTIGYMSPEQVRGQKVDHRSDIFAVGVILYELLSGHRAFTGDSAVEVMNAILKEEPPELSETNAKISPALDRIVRRCLEKKPEHRFQSASDLGFALSTLTMPSGARLETAEGLSPVTVSQSAIGKARLFGNVGLAWLISGLLLLGVIGLAWAYMTRSTTDPRLIRLAFVPPENLTFDNAFFDQVLISPDGQKLAFTARGEDGKKQLWIRPLDSTDATLLAGTEDVLRPFWSPDSRSLAFCAQGKLKRVNLDGGPPQTLCSVSEFRGGTWNRAGEILFAPTVVGGLFLVPAIGGEPKPVTAPDVSRQEVAHLSPYFLPDGRHYLFQVEASNAFPGVFVRSLDSKDVKQVLPDGALAIYDPAGWLLFVRNGALIVQPFDANRLELKGEPVSITSPSEIGVVFNAPFSVSNNGLLTWQGDGWRNYQLVWFDRDGRRGAGIGQPVKVIAGMHPRFSPDGGRVIIQQLDPQAKNYDVWTIDLARNLPTRLTSDGSFDLRPVWSPDGNRVVFRSLRNGVRGIYEKEANSVGGETLLLKDGGDPTDWSHDGRFIVYGVIAEPTRWDIWALPLFGERQPYPLLNSEFAEVQAQISPSGRWLAYVSDESGRNEVYVQSFTPEGRLGGNKMRVSPNGGLHPRFRRDGRELFFVAADGQMMVTALNPNSPTFEFARPRELFKTRLLPGHYNVGIEYDVTADGQRFLVGTLVDEPPPVQILLNWSVGLKH